MVSTCMQGRCLCGGGVLEANAGVRGVGSSGVRHWRPRRGLVRGSSGVRQWRWCGLVRGSSGVRQWHARRGLVRGSSVASEAWARQGFVRGSSVASEAWARQGSSGVHTSARASISHQRSMYSASCWARPGRSVPSPVESSEESVRAIICSETASSCSRPAKFGDKVHMCAQGSLSGTQWQSLAIVGHQWHSSAISGHQRAPSKKDALNAISGHQRAPSEKDALNGPS